MSIFERPFFDDHEEVVFATDRKAGLRAIIAVHDSAPFGMAGGGTRMWPYAHEQEAIDAALRLSRAMTYKLVLANLPAGGAKAVILADPRKDKNEALLLAFGRAVHRLNGRFIAGTDVGTNDADLAVVAKATPYVSQKQGEGKDTALATAHGVHLAMKWAASKRLGKGSLEGVRVAIQGVGRVGSLLAEALHRDGAILKITDTDLAAARRVAEALGAEQVAPDAILDGDTDVFAPCALGDVIDAGVAERIGCRVICGAANNPLADESLAEALAAREILFVPDFVANLGGVIGASPAGAGAEDEAGFLKPVERVVEVLDEASARAAERGLSLHAAAIDLAREGARARKG